MMETKLLPLYFKFKTQKDIEYIVSEEFLQEFEKKED
jgi:hypothetical protein